MSIITRNRPEVKPARRTAKPARPFGQGILASRPAYRLPCTLAEAAEMAQVFGDPADARNARPSDADFDAMADEAAMLDRYTAGFAC